MPGWCGRARAILPEGTVMNAVAPAAVGMRSLMCNLAQTADDRGLPRVRPDRLPASPGSGVCHYERQDGGEGRQAR